MALTKINASVIANNTIAVGNIADNSVDATKIASNSILTRHIDDNQVTTDQIAANTIATANIADNAVDGTKIASNSILTRHIDDNQIGIDQLNVSDGSNGQMLTTNGSGTLSFSTPSSFNADAAQVFNESGNDVDFRVESNDSANMLLVNGGDNNVSINANNTASVTNSATALAARALSINGNEGEGSDNLSFFAMADGTGNYGMEVSNGDHTAQYDLLINPIKGGSVGIGTTTTNKIFNIADPGQGGETLKLHFEAESSADKWAIYSYDRTNGHYADLSFGGNYLYIKSGGAVSIGDDSPTTRFSVLTSETNASLHNISNNGMHVGGPVNTNGYLTSSISMGYKTDGAETYKKVALVTAARGDGAARQDFHILVDDAADTGSVEIGNKKFSIDSQTGAVSMLGQASALMFNASNHSHTAGASQYTFPSTAYNVGGCYNTSNGRFTVTTPGKYLVTSQLGLNASTTGQTYLAMGPRLNDTGTVFFGGWSVKTGTTNQYGAHTASVVMDLQANDYLVFYIELSATATVLGGPHYTSVSVHKLS